MICPKSTSTPTSPIIEVSLFAALAQPQTLTEVGKTRFDRLHLIGTTSPLLAPEALKSALLEAMQGRDVGRYELALNAMHEIMPKEVKALQDPSWVDRTKQQVKAESDRLEMEVKGYKNNLIKESIRVSCVCTATL